MMKNLINFVSAANALDAMQSGAQLSNGQYSQTHSNAFLRDIPTWPKDANHYDLHEEHTDIMEQIRRYGDIYNVRVEALPQEKGWKVQDFQFGDGISSQAMLQPWMQAQHETFAIKLNYVNKDGYCPICDSRPLSTFFRKQTGNINPQYWNYHLKSVKECIGHEIVHKYFLLSYICT